MSILVVLEQQAGQWHRMSWETLAAAQQLGDSVEAAVIGKGIGTLASEAATKKLAQEKLTAALIKLGAIVAIIIAYVFGSK